MSEHVERVDKSLNDKPPNGPVFEVAIAYTRLEKNQNEMALSGDKREFAVQRLAEELRKKGLILNDVEGLSTENFLKIGAPEEILGRMAEILQIRKPTYIGLVVPFEWGEREAFVRQSEDENLFSWEERHRCLHSLLHQVVNSTENDIVLTTNESDEFIWKAGESLLSKLIATKVVKDVFLLHDEKKRKHLLDNWAWKWTGFTSQPIDTIYSYFGPKVAIYFAFLGMYTQWLFYPSIFGLFIYFINMRSWESLTPPLVSMLAVMWAVLFLQFWKRKNAALLAR
ncbi:hypothetical protein KP509_18G050100 [Ceratopteris richardii]|uniref:Uncharacterized protein n=1 Tax=Ceratopteris richardii TaxID=49495 RepID=A0A8T2SQ92_CERRI|nr:hypothetical protein KP509_18G050100 [Ceratopteris richardii]